MDAQTPQSPGSDPLLPPSPLISITAKLNRKIIGILPEKSRTTLRNIFEVCLMNYDCIWSYHRPIMNVVLRAAIIFALLDENVLRLVNMLDAANRHYLTCIDTFTTYMTKDSEPVLVVPPPPDATKEELELLFRREGAKTQKLLREQIDSAYRDSECMKDELTQRLKDKMSHFLVHKHERGSLENAFMNLLIAARTIPDTHDDDDEKGYSVDDADKVKNFVEACEHLLSYL